MPWTFYNANGQRLTSAATNISVLDIDGATDIGAAIVDADLFIVDDGAGGTNRKTAASRIVTYVGANAAASQAEMEAASSNTVFATPGRTHNHPGVAKGWCQYEQTDAHGIITSYNVTSVTDVGVGQTDVVWATDFSGADYAVMVTPVDAGSGAHEISVQAAGKVRTLTRDVTNSGTLIDKETCCIAWGDQ